MIPRDLKPGALVRCIRSTSSLPEGDHVLKGYIKDPNWAIIRVGVLIEGYPNHMDGTDQGWMLERFKLIRDGDGSDYQGPDDVDLIGGPVEELYGRQYRSERGR